MDKPRNIYQRINDIRRDVKKIAKDIEVREGGAYRATSHDEVTKAVRELEVEHGVLCYPVLLETHFTDTGRESKGGTPLWRYVARYSIRFVNVDQPDDFIEMPQEAHSLDYGDKAPGKAESYATKRATMKMYRLVTGENDEDRPEAESRLQRISQDQQDELVAVLDLWPSEQRAAAEKRLATYLKAQFSSEKLADIPAKDFDRVKKTLLSNTPKEEA